jgi:hypothetical protein
MGVLDKEINAIYLKRPSATNILSKESDR